MAATKHSATDTPEQRAKKLNEKIAELEALIAALTARVEALETP